MGRRTKGLSATTISRAVRIAVEEDVGRGDVTTSALVPSDATCHAAILARESCVVSGQRVAAAVFKFLDRRIRYSEALRDGQRAGRGEIIATVKGPTGAILTGERTALNFLQRLSGIATLASEFVNRVRPMRTMILDTRKTTPGLRILEKYAVVCGGGTNHRVGLHDRALIKDNHREVCRSRRMTLEDAVRAVRRHCPGIMVEVEVESPEELADALRAKPEWVLLDNMSCSDMRRCVRIAKSRALLEASGGVNLANVRRIAATGVDAISVGSLTHSARAVDLSLEMKASTCSAGRRSARR